MDKKKKEMEEKKAELAKKRAEKRKLNPKSNRNRISARFPPKESAKESIMTAEEQKI